MNRSEVRQGVLAARTALSPRSVKEKSGAVMDRVMSLEAYLKAKSLMVYVDFRNEVQTGGLIVRSLAAGKIVSVPITDVKGRKLIPSRLMSYPEDLAPGTWGILEPRPECVRPLDPGELDLVIVPGVAFDPKGNRLGYGGGFYDRFLPRTRPGTVYIAPAFEVQVVDDVFPGSHDVPVHVIVTEKRIIAAGIKNEKQV